MDNCIVAAADIGNYPVPMIAPGKKMRRTAVGKQRKTPNL